MDSKGNELWFGDRKGTMYFIERPREKFGGIWRCLGGMFDSSISIYENEEKSWTDNPNAALAWKTREGAELHIQKYHLWGLGYIVTEHEFINHPPLR